MWYVQEKFERGEKKSNKNKFILKLNQMKYNVFFTCIKKKWKPTTIHIQAIIWRKKIWQRFLFQLRIVSFFF